MRAQQVDFLLAGFRDAAGANLAGGLVYTYVAGTTTEKATYTARDKSGTEANPIVLDAYGKKLVWADGAYKFVVKDSAGNTLYTFDNLEYGIPDSTLEYGATSSGAANVYAISAAPAWTEYAAGQVFEFLAHQTNTNTTPTLAVNGLAAKTFKRYDGSALHAGDITSGQWIRGVYDGTYVRLVPQNLVSGSWVPTFTGFSAGPTNVLARYLKIGKLCALSWTMTAGTSNATGFTMSAPFAAAAIAGMTWANRLDVVYDNGAYSTSPGKAEIISASSTITMYFNQNGTTLWTNANGKASGGTLIYEVE